jgi:hypothetical protein
MIGSWINCVLVSTELLVACIYWIKYNRRMNRKTKVLLCVMLCNDIAHSIVVCSGVYMVRPLLRCMSDIYENSSSRGSLVVSLDMNCAK